jgi:hypothetical protein
MPVEIKQLSKYGTVSLTNNSQIMSVYLHDKIVGYSKFPLDLFSIEKQCNLLVIFLVGLIFYDNLLHTLI